MYLSPGHSKTGQVHWERICNDASSHLCPEVLWVYVVFVLTVPIILGYVALR